MNRWASVAAAIILSSVAACGRQAETPGDETWVGTITTEGDVTTVVNESGSVWGGTATLVEEASIGVETGADEYLLDQGATVFATDSVIFVAQPTIPAVRRYAFDGEFLGNIGGSGQGPGEYTSPSYVAANASGRIFVYDGQGSRVNVYDDDGNAIDTWTLPNLACCVWPLSLSAAGGLRIPVLSWEGATGPGSPRYGVQALDDAGEPGATLWVPDYDYERLTVSVLGGEWELVPFAAKLDWAPAREGLVAGVPDRYRFEILHRDGTRRRVERYWEAVSVDPAHADWKRASQIAQIRDQAPGWTWNGDAMPTHQPAYDQLIPTASGETWVARSAESEQVRDCSQDPADDLWLDYWRPCWRGKPIIDVFGADGRYQGDIEVPEGLTPRRQGLFVRRSLVLGVVEDEAGTILVKRYRLVLPEND